MYLISKPVYKPDASRRVKNSLFRTKGLLALLLIQSFLLLAPAFGGVNEEIIIDKATKSLIAPDGTDYQWYFNDVRVEGATGKSLEVKKAGLYTVELTNLRGNKSHQSALIAIRAGTIIKIYLIGDSTVMSYGSSAYPQAGWGQILKFFFNSSVQIINKAIGGRSSKSFHVEGRWTPIRDGLQAGDFVFIQFGHNDRDFAHPERYADTATYKSYLKIYVNETRAKGANPVLITPMILNAWRNGALRNVFTEGANDYRGAMVQVANQLKVPLIDLNMKSYNLFNSLGGDYMTRYIYFSLLPGEYPNFPNGNSDGTHFQEMGAIEISKLIAQGINELKQDANVGLLAANLVPSYQVATSTNNASAGLITRTNSYPAGVNVTLKVVPKTGFTFQKWTDTANATVSTNVKFSFVMGTAAQSYNAVYQGSGSTTITIQENTTGFCSVDGTIDSNNAGYTGAGFANANNVLGAGVSWKVNIPSSGSYTLKWNQANANAADRTAKLLVNGTSVISNISFPSTSSWTTWSEVSATANLTAGTATIRLEATTAAGLSNIDYLKVTGTDPTAVSCTTGARNIESSLAADQGTERLSAYPNPTNGSFVVKAKGEFKYTIKDTFGKVKERGKGLDECVAGGDLKPGMYILRIHTVQGSKQIKVIKN